MSANELFNSSVSAGDSDQAMFAAFDPVGFNTQMKVPSANLSLPSIIEGLFAKWP